MKRKKQKLKILFICQNFWPENFRSTDVVKNLISDGNYIEVLTSNPNYPEGKIYKGYSWFNFKTEIFGNIKIHRIPTIPRGRNNYFLIFLNYLSFILFGIFFGFFKMFNKKFDIVLVFASSPIFQVIVGYFMKITVGAKLVTWVQDLWPENLQALRIINNKILLNKIRNFTKFLYNLNTIIIGQSKSYVDVLKKRTTKKVYYVPNYSEIFNSSIIKKKKKNKNFVLVYAGNLGKAQKLLTLLKAANKLRHNNNFFIKIFGYGSEYPILKSYIIKNNIKNVKLCGKVSKTQIYKEYMNADALFLSLSKNKYLNYTIPAKLQTYLSFGKPIIASSNGEIKKIIKESKSGLCSSSEDVKNLTFNINKMVNLNKRLIDKYSRNSKKYYYENFRSELINFKFRKIFNKII